MIKITDLADDPLVANISGATLGRYTLLKRLASSGDAEVLLARASGAAGFEHHVVIKRMRAKPGTDPQAIGRFLDELRLAGSLHHHHIVQVHDAGREGNDYYFAMEYVHGEDLRKILARCVARHEYIPLEHVVTIGLAIAQALHHAHEQRTPDGRPLELVHRDVSPSNVIVGYDGTVKVVDFGVAKAAVRTTQTGAGALRGKAPYMAPEQCAGRPLDRRADIFALGIVLWELCTARRLFKGVNDFMTMAAIVSGKVVPPSKLRPDLPADFEHIIMRALSLAPEARHQTAMELCVALEEMATNNIIRISQAALATYLKHLFGQRPEPWLVDGDVSNEAVDIDFDGDAGGVVRVTREQVMNLDAVREVTTAQMEQNAEQGYDEHEFDEEPMTELSESSVPMGTATDHHEIAAAVEAAKLLRPSAIHAAVTPPPELPDFDVSTEPRAARSGPEFDAKTEVADFAEVDRLRRISARMPTAEAPGRAPPGRSVAPQLPAPRPTGVLPPHPTPQPGGTSPPPRPTPQPGATSPPPRPTPQPGATSPPPRPTPQPWATTPPRPTPPTSPPPLEGRPVMLNQQSAPLAWEPMPEQAPRPTLNWPALIIIAIIGLATGAVLIDLLLN